MAGKLIPLEEAAKQLGVSPDELNDLRQQQQIYGYRDGATWKFKPEDVDRLRQERDGGKAEDSGDLMDLDAGDDLLSPDTSDEDVGSIKLESSDDLLEESSSFDLKVGDLDFDSSSDVIPISGETKEPPAGGSAVTLEFDTGEIDLSDEPAAAPPAPPPPPGPREILPTSEAFSVADEPKAAKSSEEGSIHSSDDELVLGAPEGGSDITLAPGDSGISLVASDDSGLSLDRPLMLGIASETGAVDLSDSAEFDSDASVEIKADDDFLLQPLEEAGDDMTDSGSQVIALDSSGGFDSATDMVAAGAMSSASSSMLEEDAAPEGFDSFEPVQAGAAAAASATAGSMAAVREMQFTTLNIVSLSFCVLILTLIGIMMYDLIRNIWSWNEPYSLNSSLMDLLLPLLGQ